MRYVVLLIAKRVKDNARGTAPFSWLPILIEDVSFQCRDFAEKRVLAYLMRYTSVTSLHFVPFRLREEG